MNKCCKVCKDAGKNASVYETHWVRERGVVVCPTLLSQECRYCGKNGHTPKYCRMTKKAILSTRQEERKEDKPKEENKYKNCFDALINESDDEEEEVEWPGLSLRSDLPSTVTLRPHQVSYAEMLAKKQEPKKEVNVAAVMVPQKEKVTKRVWNWADDESSDEEEEMVPNMQMGVKKLAEPTKVSVFPKKIMNWADEEEEEEEAGW
jgi:hypothetical protein